METTNFVIARDTDLPLDQALEKSRGLLQEAGYYHMEGGMGRVVSYGS